MYLVFGTIFRMSGKHSSNLNHESSSSGFLAPPNMFSHFSSAAIAKLSAYPPIYRIPRQKRLPALLAAILCFLALSMLTLFEHSNMFLSRTNRPLALSRLTYGNYAFATFLSAATRDRATGRDEDDLYFIQTRVLVYQLLHDPKTRTAGYPVVVLVTENVPHSMRERLYKDGAIVIEVPLIKSDWIHTATLEWQDVLSKVHLFNLVQYDKVAFFDSDTYLTRSVDGIFDDTAAQPTANMANASFAPEDEGKQPDWYLFAGNSGAGTINHTYPQYKGNNLNAGCMVLGPSRETFNYYMRVASIKDRFLPKYPEQNLWAYVHRRDGNMPWKQLHYDWNTNYANMEDIKNGLASLHVKWWTTAHDMALRDILLKKTGEMEGFWQMMDARNGHR